MADLSQIVFRSLEPEDLEPCVDLYRVIYSHRPWREQWKHSVAKRRLEEIFGAPRRFCFGAWDKDDLVGFCLGTLITRADRYSAQICEFGIDSEQDHPNLASALIEYSIGQLAEVGVKSIYTMMLSENPAFQKFNEAGFHISRHYVMLVHRME